MLTTSPWEIDSDLTAERLEFVASLLMKGRDDALDRHEPSIGDNGWTLGCKSYAYAKHQIAAAAALEANEWLDIVDPGAQFVFKIGKVPVRFYHGSAEEPHDRTLHQGLAELQQLSFAFHEKPDVKQLIYRFAIETAPDGGILQIVFLGTTGTTIGCFWPVPLARATASLHTIDQSRDEGVALDPPKVGSPHERDDKGAGEKDSGKGAA